VPSAVERRLVHEVEAALHEEEVTAIAAPSDERDPRARDLARAAEHGPGG